MAQVIKKQGCGQNITHKNKAIWEGSEYLGITSTLFQAEMIAFLRAGLQVMNRRNKKK